MAYDGPMDGTTTPPRDLGEVAYSAIRAALRDGSLPPGMRVTETDLAARFGVSRTPVRQAIARLESEGLLTHESRRGLSVARPDHAQVVELYVMREIMEGAAARLAAQHASDTELAAMAELLDTEPGAFTDARALAELNLRFHGMIYLATHNRYLLRTLEQLSAHLALLPSLLTLGGRAKAAHAEHRAVLAALVARDGTGAEEAARAHARSAQRHRLAWLLQTLGVPGAGRD